MPAFPQNTRSYPATDPRPAVSESRGPIFALPQRCFEDCSHETKYSECDNLHPGKLIEHHQLKINLETNFTTNYAVAKIQTAADIDRLIDRLGTGDNGASKKSPCLLGTRRAVLKRITEWIEQSSLHGFCLSGQAGAGKSSIAASIASRERAFKRLGAVFHFTRDDQVRNKAASFDHRVGDRREPRHPADGA
ncbi:hypothetical protein FRB94_011496 [Tulasnella sp. JGI-2019a]|nr:hypothetical protein FRB94_011496 [Tulasnella sp. JGI-2019a]